MSWQKVPQSSNFNLRVTMHDGKLCAWLALGRVKLRKKSLRLCFLIGFFRADFEPVIVDRSIQLNVVGCFTKNS
jgi:hypothetical protein